MAVRRLPVLLERVPGRAAAQRRLSQARAHVTAASFNNLVMLVSCCGPQNRPFFKFKISDEVASSTIPAWCETSLAAIADLP
jgi:hypothetical protein